jgi:hypothetical protein
LPNIKDMSEIGWIFFDYVCYIEILVCLYIFKYESVFVLVFGRGFKGNVILHSALSSANNIWVFEVQLNWLMLLFIKSHFEFVSFFFSLFTFNFLWIYGCDENKQFEIIINKSLSKSLFIKVRVQNWELVLTLYFTMLLRWQKDLNWSYLEK